MGGELEKELERAWWGGEDGSVSWTYGGGGGGIGGGRSSVSSLSPAWDGLLSTGSIVPVRPRE